MNVRTTTAIAVLAVIMTGAIAVAQYNQRRGQNAPPPGNTGNRVGQPEAPAADDEAFEGHMSAAGGALRRLGRSAFDATTREKDLAAVSILQGAMVGAKSELQNVPEADAARAKFGNDQTAYRTAFRMELIALLAETLTLERAVLQGDTGAAKASVKKIVGIRNRGHDLFQPGVDMHAVNLEEKLATFDEPWVPKVVGGLNGQLVKVAKFEGEYVWHRHADEDELFLVLDGTIEIHFRDRVVALGAGEFCIVPRGVEHKPVAKHQASVLLFEPASTRNTGDVDHGYTIEAEDLERI